MLLYKLCINTNSDKIAWNVAFVLQFVLINVCIFPSFIGCQPNKYRANSKIACIFRTQLPYQDWTNKRTQNRRWSIDSGEKTECWIEGTSRKNTGIDSMGRKRRGAMPNKVQRYNKARMGRRRFNQKTISASVDQILWNKSCVTNKAMWNDFWTEHNKQISRTKTYRHYNKRKKKLAIYKRKKKQHVNI